MYHEIMNALVRNSLLTLGLLFSFVFFIIILIGLLLDFVSLPFAIGLTVIINFLIWLVSPAISDFIYRHIYKTRFYNEDDFRTIYPQLHGFIKVVCDSSKITFPKIGIIEDKNPTAFTYGSHKGNARIVFTQGILHYLNEDETKAVLAHEIGHISNNDFIIMTIASTLVQILYEIYTVLIRTKSRGSKKGNPLVAIAIISYIFYFIGTYLLLFLSRTREYFADQFSASVTKSPHTLTQALVKIAYGIVEAEDTENGKRLLHATRALGLIDVKNAGHIGSIIKVSSEPNAVAQVMVFDIISPWAKILEIGSTHPLTGRRILALEKIAQSLGQNKLIDIDSAIKSKQIDNTRLYKNFLFELILYVLPYTLPLIGLLLFGIGGFLLVLGIALILRINYMMAESAGVKSNVFEEMCNPYASPMRGRSVIFNGAIVGRGVPGFVLSEDMMFQDDTGLAYLDYSHILGFLGDFFFAIKKVKALMGRSVTVEGWFFRGIMHHVTLRKVIDGNEIIQSHPKFWQNAIGGLIAVVGLVMIVGNL